MHYSTKLLLFILHSTVYLGKIETAPVPKEVNKLIPLSFSRAIWENVAFFQKKIGMERMVYLCFESKYSNKICQGLRVLLIRLLCGYNGVLWASLGQLIKIMFTVTMSMEIRYQHQLSTAISAADAYQLNIYNSISWKWEVHFLKML